MVDPHRARSRTLLQAHPEIERLFGRSPVTAWVIALLIGLQLVIAAVVGEHWWWAILPGAFVSHALYAAIHECAHGLVLSNKRKNLSLAILANVPMAIPFAAAYSELHLRHHLRPGDYDRDPDVPSRWEIEVFGDGALGKLAWLILNPVIQSLRSRRLIDPPRGRAAVALNVVVVLAADALVFLALGPSALAYLLGAFAASMVLPPLAARYLQEHFVVPGARPGQETFSYYGPLNRLSLNIGFHNEHHDFPAVPWHRLPALNRIAAAEYGALHSHRSWMSVWLRFVADRRVSLGSRVQR